MLKKCNLKISLHIHKELWKKKEKLYQSKGSVTVLIQIINYIKKKYELQFQRNRPRIWDKNSEWRLDGTEFKLFVHRTYSSRNKHHIQQTWNIDAKSYDKVFNPFENYFQNLEKWNGENHIQRLTSYVRKLPIENRFKYIWKMVDKVCTMFIERGYINKQCFVLYNTKQNSGKTSFWDFWFRQVWKNTTLEDIGVDKDGLIALCKTFWLILTNFRWCPKRMWIFWRRLFQKYCEC